MSIAFTETVLGAFSRCVRRCSDDCAVESGQRSLTYRELDQLSDSWRQRIEQAAGRQGLRVMVVMESSAELIVALLAVFKAGDVFIPVAPLLPDGLFEEILAQSDPHLIIVDNRFYLATAAIAGRLGLNVGWIHVRSNGTLAARKRPAGSRRAKHHPETCYLYFTSGTMSCAKAIQGSHRGLAHFIAWEMDALQLRQGTRVSQLNSPVFDPFLRDVFLPLCSGGVVCIPSPETVQSPRETQDWIENAGVEIVHTTPSSLRRVMAAGGNSNRLRRLRYLLLAGEQLYPSDAEAWFGRFGTATQLVNLYGPTETMLAKFAFFLRPEDRGRERIPVGKPIPGTRFYLVDERGSRCRRGDVGEVWIAPPFPVLGYFGQPGLNRRTVLDNPYDGGSGSLYKTGDLGRLNQDGDLELVGRRDLQVQVNGVRYELEGIERIFCRHPFVENAAVISQEAEDGEVRLQAFLVLGQEVALEQLKAFAADYVELRPVALSLRQVNELPTLPSGKIDRRALALEEVG